MWIIWGLAVHHSSTMFICGKCMFSRGQIRSAADISLKIQYGMPAPLEKPRSSILDATSDIWPACYRLDTLLRFVQRVTKHGTPTVC